VKNIFRIVLLLGLAGLALWLWTVLFPAPEKVIRHRMDEIARTASFGPDENPLAIAGKAQRLAGFVATNVEVRLDSEMARNFSGRDEVMQAAAAAHSATSALKVQFLDPEIVVAADKRSATVNVTLKAQPAGRELLVQQVRLTFRKLGQDWLVTRIETLRALS
jgi:hypothetical protein